jgi:hypothetical protein
MTFTAEQKSQLAKLMATENLTVQHQKIHTAKFDPINRVLYLPIWQNMSGDLYDLLTGHEVGHALYTPADGWHSAATDKSKPSSYKNFLNVVEDARIEKKVKRRYPGLKTSFQKAYKELFERDFFGIRYRDINSMAFIDRLNVFTKSQYTADWIKFTDEERSFISEVESLETWDDVVRLTDKIFAYSKDEQFELQQNDFVYSDDDHEEGEDGDGVKSFDMDSADDGENSQDADSGSDSDSDIEKDSKPNENETEDVSDGDDDPEGSYDFEQSSSLNRVKESEISEKDAFIPDCVTDEEFRRRENLLLDEKSKPYIYLNIPKYNKQYSVTPAEKVISQIEEYYSAIDPFSNKPIIDSETIRGFLNNFKNRNDRFINLLVKEFEMRKAAKAFSKSRLCDTGDIDINKLSSYKFDDNIFRKVMLTPKGKNHGLILLLDKSGSMSSNMAGSIEQILILSMFCRKVNIPFVVYGFGCSDEAYTSDHGSKGDMYKIFSREKNEIDICPVAMREYLNSSMSNSNFTRAIKALLCLKWSFEYRVRHQRPKSESLSNTPLTEAIFATGYLMKEFRKKHNLDLSSLIIIHDGDSDDINKYWGSNEYTGKPTIERFHPSWQNVIIQDVANKFQYKLENMNKYDTMLLSALKWFNHVTGSKVFGFFLTEGSHSAKFSLRHRYVFNDGEHYETKRYKAHVNRDYGTENALLAEMNKIIKEFKSEKFVACKTHGYHDFYIVAGGTDLNAEDGEIEIEGKVTAGKLKNAFMKFNKRRIVNRVLVSRFIQGIAA